MKPPVAAKVVKDSSMLKQKEMIADNYRKLETAAEDGRKVVSTFVPGNLNELIMCFDLLNNLPEINAIQNGMRKKTGGYIMEAEKRGHSEDVCTYVKADIGSIAKGNLGPDGQQLPNPDLLLLSYTGCFTFMKWFELLREHYKCETAMLHVPYQGDGKINGNMVSYLVKQLKQEVIPKLERVSGVKFDIDRLRENLARSARAEEDFVWVMESARSKPSPIDAYFGGVYYIGPIFTAFRGTEAAAEYYRLLRAEIAERLAAGQGPVTPAGDMDRERYRLVVEGPPNWTSFRDFWKMFYEEGAVVVASTYTKVGGLYDRGFRHDPDHPLESLAEVLPGLLHQPQPAFAHRPDRAIHRRVPGGRTADQFDQELQQLLRRPVAHAAGNRAAHRQAGRLHRKRSGRSALLLAGEYQEPARELLPDDRSAARRQRRRRGTRGIGRRRPYARIHRHRSRFDHHEGRRVGRGYERPWPRHHQFPLEL